MFRVACLNDPKDVLAVIAPEKRDKSPLLAVLPVAELVALGLSVQSAKIDTVLATRSSPELNVTTFTNDSAKCADIQKNPPPSPRRT